MEKKKNDCPNKLLTTLMIVCVTLSVVILGIVSYDKFIKKYEGKVVPVMPQEGVASTNCEHNYPVSTVYGEEVSSVKKIEITRDNQTFMVGNKEVKLRIGNQGEDTDILFVNDVAASYTGFSYSPVKFNSAYLTDKFVFFTTGGNKDGAINYAINEDGNEIVTNYNAYFVDNFKIVNGYLHASGSKFCMDSELDECKSEEYSTKDLLIKFIDNTIIVTEVK